MAERELAAILRVRNEASAELKNFRDGLEGTTRGFAGIPPAAALASAGIAAAGAAVVALTKAAIDLGEAMDDAMDTIIVGTGATGAALEGLQADFRSVVADVPTDFGRASQAIADLNTRTGQTGVGLQQLTAQMLELSRITKTDLGENIRQGTRVFGDWGIAVADQAEALDKLFRASQASGASVAELSAKVVQFGAPMRQLGFDFEEAVAIMAKFEREGVNTETVMGTMRIALARLAESGLDPATTFERLMVTIRDMEDPLEATSLAMEIFGKRGGADMAAAIREGRFAIDEMRDTITGAGDSILETAAKTNDAQQQMQVALNAIALEFSPIGTAAFQMTADTTSAFVELVRGARSAIQEIQEFSRRAGGGGGDPNHLLNDIMEEERRNAIARLDRARATAIAPPGEAAASAAGLSADELTALRGANQEQRDAARAAEREAAAAARDAARAQAEAQREAAAAVREAERIARDVARAQAAAQREAEREAERAQRAAERAAELEARRIEQIRELGQRRADAINEATLAAQDAIEKADRQAEERIQAARDEFAQARAIAAEREQLQKNITDSLNRVREIQGGRRLGTQQLREIEDFDLRRAREDEDLRNRRAGAGGQSAQQAVRDQEMLNALRFKGNSIEINAAELAIQRRREGIKDQTAAEDAAIALRRQREDEDRQRSMQRRADDLLQARNDAAEIEAIRKQLTAPLEAFNQKVLEDNLAEKIAGYERARLELINTANQRVADVEGRADATFRQGVERLNAPGGVVQHITLNNYGVIGDEAIQQMTEQTFDEAEQMLAHTG